MTTAAVSQRLVLADLVPGARVRDVTLVLAGAGLTGLAAQVSITTSLSPVPFTLQTLAVLVTGAALGSVRGVLSMLLYVAAGSAGLPWFAGHTSGFSGPSAGYLVGFVIAAGVVGELARRGNDRNVVRTALLMVAGNVVIYAFGVLWLMHEVPAFSFGQAVHYGMTVFLISDLAKIVLAALAFPAAWKLARR
ncbi:MAG TPA: biotin transporter BioY [Jatrophihabitans sp.]|jgi:biotin transport system substrate-specific component